MFGPKRIKPLTNEQKTYYNNLGIDLITSGLLGAIFATLKSNGIDSDSLIEEARQEAFKAVYINPAYFEQHEEMKHEIIEGDRKRHV